MAMSTVIFASDMKVDSLASGGILTMSGMVTATTGILAVLSHVLHRQRAEGHTCPIQSPLEHHSQGFHYF